MAMKITELLEVRQRQLSIEMADSLRQMTKESVKMAHESEEQSKVQAEQSKIQFAQSGFVFVFTIATLIFVS